jgi:RNA polymerase sigma factor (sigma-70 family)
MNGLSDQQLLRDYAGGHSEAAFAELVRRYIDLVYSAAVRMTCNAHLAEDVAQGTFVALAQQAGELADRPILSGWLHRTARNLACKSVRTEERRRAREQEAATMNELLVTQPDVHWEIVAPHLDAALGDLSEPDRDALLLRYFERKSAEEMGRVLGISDEAAQKRVNRAVDRLRTVLAKRGAPAGAAGLALVLSVKAVQAAPAGLAATISSSAMLAGSSLATATKVIAMTVLQKTLITTSMTLAIGVGIYEASHASALRRQVQSLQQQQSLLTDSVTQLSADNGRLTNLLAQANEAPALSQAQLNELLRLRGQSAQAQSNTRELARLKSTLGQPTGPMRDFLTNAMASGLRTATLWKQKNVRDRLARMEQMLSLNPDQSLAISNLMSARIDSDAHLTLDLLSGGLTPQQKQAQLAGRGELDTSIKAVLTPDQLASYPDYLQAEKTLAATSAAQGEAASIAADFELSKDQRDKISSLLYDAELKESASQPNGQSGNLFVSLQTSVEVHKAQLEAKLKLLEAFLTPDQLATYRQKQMSRIEMLAGMTQMMTQKQ